MPLTLSLEAGVTLPGEPTLRVGASVWWPEQPQTTRAALVCLAGGGMNRRYFDLRPADAREVAARNSDAVRERVPAPTPAPALRDTVSSAHEDESFSFAAQMTQRGYVVIALDHLGIGDSSRPADGYALTPQLIVQANQNAMTEILARLRAGRLAETLPAQPMLRSIGVGHSMGAMLTVLQQFHGRQHAGLALLGFSTRGLPQFLPPDVRALAVADTTAVRTRLIEFARRMFVQPYPALRSSGEGAELFGCAKADARGVAALKDAADMLLPAPGLLSMLPGNVAMEAAQIEVPVFLGLGERDLTGPPDEAPDAFTSSRAVTLEVLSGAGHSHFLFASRVALFDGLDRWARESLQ